MMSKILVTGGTGYIGSHTVVELLESGYETVVVDNLSNSTAGVINGIEGITGIRPVFVKADCTDKNAIHKILKTERNVMGIIHFAASKSVGESLSKPLTYYRNNIDSLLTLLELMPEFNVKGLVFSSSCTVYGRPDLMPVGEDAPVKKAESPYGNTKQIGEEIIRDAIGSDVSYKSIILRYFNPIGAHPSAKIGELPNGVPQNLVPFLTQTAAGIHKELRVFGDDYSTPDGSCIRDYINVVDLAKAHVTAIGRMLENSDCKPLEYYNLGTGKGFSVLELIHTFENVTGVKVPYKIAGRRVGDIEQIWADPRRANEILGWKAVETLENTLRSAWKWQQAISNL
ncbi:MAG: UDP-glucose 4-epimerase GalE [Dysgonamonadaceae bacterium]|nr:UDP-glucose 4-epimerase GalE [Dysgonamonadaceae bacterium]